MIAQRAAALEHAFAEIARTRMAGVDLLHPALRVQAVGFCALDEEMAVGVLIAPWFVNLICLPLQRVDGARVGVKRERAIGEHALEFTSAYEPQIGAYESCALFTPPLPFGDHAVAELTAKEVMRALAVGGVRQPPRAAVTRASFFGRRPERERGDR